MPSLFRRVPKPELGLACCIGLVLLSRLVAVTSPLELNVDESQMIAQAMRLQDHPVPWLAMDGTTSGPVNSWLLLLAHQFGLPLSYRGVHAFAALCLAVSLVATYFTARAMYSARSALLAFVPAALWLSLNLFNDFLQYASELASIALISGALWLSVAPARHHGTALLRFALAALALGLVPWAKLQAAPIAATAGVLIVLRAWLAAAGRRERMRILVTGLAGALLPSLLLLAWLRNAGAIESFWRSYIQVALQYAASKSTAEFVRDLVLLVAWRHSGALLLPALGAAFVAARWLGRGPSVTRRLDDSIPFALLAISLFAVAKPTTQFPHYQLLLVMPAILVAAASLERLREHASADEPTWRGRFRALWLPVAVAFPVLFAAHHADWLMSEHRRRTVPHAASAQHQIAEAVRAAAPHMKSLAVWGWHPSLYVELQVAPSTRHAINHFLMVEGEHQAFLRRGLLDDLQTEQPDTVAVVRPILRLPGMNPESPFPELDALLRANYVRRSEQGFPHGTTVTVYTRRDPRG